MQKKLSKILILFLALAIFIAPISPIFENQNGKLALDAGINKAEAVERIHNIFVSPILNVKPKTDTTAQLLEVTISMQPTMIVGTDNTTRGQPNSGDYESLEEHGLWTYSEEDTGILQNEDWNVSDNGVWLDIYSNPSWELQQKGYWEGESTQFLRPDFQIPLKLNRLNRTNIITVNTGDLLTINTQYRAQVRLVDDSWNLSGTTTVYLMMFGDIVSFTTDSTNTPGSVTQDNTTEEGPVEGPVGEVLPSLRENAAYDLNCSLVGSALSIATLGWLGDDGNVAGCVGQLFYIIWRVTSSLAELAAHIFDFFIYYSTNSSAYTTGFVTKGWGVVRDIANIFFIIALLYIAIKTILGLSVTDNKKLIATIVISALLINFSLFITEVVIDSSNILAKVFYNQIESKDMSGKLTNTENKGGEKSISLGLVRQFNPQVLMTNAEAINNIGAYIFLLLIFIAVTLYLSWIFWTVAVLFVGRVIMLWMCMIFSPFAFASYSFKEKIPGFGHQEWWDNLLKNAFLAPIFIFMLYLIVMFADLANDFNKLTYGNEGTSQSIATNLTSDKLMLKIMAMLIPFALIFILLKKSKEMAVSLSGEMGKMLMKGQGYLTGTAGLGMVAAYLGQKGLKGASALGQKTIGRGSRWISNNISEKTAVGRFWKNRTSDLSKSSFNFGKAIPAGLRKKMGITDIKPKYANLQEREEAKDKKRKERAKDYEVKDHEDVAINVRDQKVKLAKVKGEQESIEVEGYSAKVLESQKDLDDATRELTAEIAKLRGKGKTAEADSMEKEIKDLEIGDVFVSTDLDKKHLQNMSTLKSNKERIQGKINLKNQQIGEKQLALNNAQAAALNAKDDPIEKKKFDDEADDLRKDIQRMEKERGRYIGAIQANLRKHDKLAEPIHHAELELTQVENEYSKEMNTRLSNYADTLTKKRPFKRWAVGGRRGLEKTAAEIKIRVASEHKQKAAPTSHH
ncbi:MAG: hypothetical protein WC662_04040 [Candidatus Paceibacterota bacterium]|jgi:hypothetical protein